MTPSTAPHTDIRNSHPVYRFTPEAIWPYLSLMRLDRPIGTWLLFLPAAWSLAMLQAPLLLYLLFAIGSLVMRGAGCVINDLWDRDFDKSVERTKNRPLASGAVTPSQALIFLCGLLLTGLVILLQLPAVAIGLGVLSLVPVILYPLAKRVTWYPQAVLGLTFNFGALMGGAAITNSVLLPYILLYVAGFFWTLGYDTIYAHQDIADDSLIGVKSTARKFGTKSPLYIGIFYSCAALLIYTAGLSMGCGVSFYICWALGCAHLFSQIAGWKMEDATDCLYRFRSNRDFGLIILLGFLLGS